MYNNNNEEATTPNAILQLIQYKIIDKKTTKDKIGPDCMRDYGNDYLPAVRPLLGCIHTERSVLLAAHLYIGQQ